MSVRGALLRLLAVASAVTALGVAGAAGATTTRTLTIDPASYDADGYEVSTGSVTIDHVISEQQSKGTLSFATTNSSVCTIAAKVVSGVTSRTQAIITFIRGGQCTVTISVGAWSTYSEASDSISFALSDPGSVVSFSQDSNQSSVSSLLAGKTVTDVDNGYTSMSYTECFVADGAAYCRGENGLGQLGNNSTSDSGGTVVAVHTSDDGTGSELPGDATVLSISVGTGGHVCAIAMPAGGTTDADKRAFCWGDNSNGQLGDGTTTSSLVPVAVDDCDCGATEISAGYDHTCAIIGGDVYCWGYGSKGQLGNGTLIDTSTPTAVAYDSDGALDDPDSADPADTVTSALPGSATFSGVVAGPDGSCVIADGAAYCWGKNSDGRLGDGTTTRRVVPVAVDATGDLAGLTVTQIAMGGRHSFSGAHDGSRYVTCAVASGWAYCWGNDAQDVVGNGAGGSTTRPDAVAQGDIPADATVTSVDVGYVEACLTASGGVYCWGSDNGASPNAASTASGKPLNSSQASGIAVAGNQSGPSINKRITTIRTFATANQTISFTQPSDTTTATASVALTASATSGLSVSLTSTTASVCTVSGTTATILTAGTCSITASQAGDGDWATAADVTRSFAISSPTTTTTAAPSGGGSSPTTTTTTTSTTSTTTTTTTVLPTPSASPEASADPWSGAPAPIALLATSGPLAAIVSTSTSAGEAIPLAEPGVVAATPGGDLELVLGPFTADESVTVSLRSPTASSTPESSTTVPGATTSTVPSESSAEAASLAATVNRFLRSCRAHLILPAGLAAGDYELVVTVDGSTTMTITVRVSEVTGSGSLDLSSVVDQFETGADVTTIRRELLISGALADTSSNGSLPATE